MISRRSWSFDRQQSGLRQPHEVRHGVGPNLLHEIRCNSVPNLRGGPTRRVGSISTEALETGYNLA